MSHKGYIADKRHALFSVRTKDAGLITLIIIILIIIRWKSAL